MQINLNTRAFPDKPRGQQVNPNQGQHSAVTLYAYEYSIERQVLALNTPIPKKHHRFNNHKLQILQTHDSVAPLKV